MWQRKFSIIQLCKLQSMGHLWKLWASPSGEGKKNSQVRVLQKINVSIQNESLPRQFLTFIIQHYYLTLSWHDSQLTSRYFSMVRSTTSLTLHIHRPPPRLSTLHLRVLSTTKRLYHALDSSHVSQWSDTPNSFLIYCYMGWDVS